MEETLAQVQLQRDIIKADQAKKAFEAARANAITEATAVEVRDRISQQVRDTLDAAAADLARSVEGKTDETAIHYALTETANHWLASLGKDVADRLPDADVGQAFRRAIRPKDILRVSEWSEKNRVIETGTNLPGPWRNKNAPHLTEIMDCMSEHSPVRQVTLKKSSGVGGSEIIWNYIGYLIDEIENKEALLVVPTEGLRDRAFNPKLKKMIKQTPVLKEKFELKRIDSTSTIDLTSWPGGGALHKIGANSEADLSSLHVPIILLDEVSRFPWNVGGEGDPVALAENRQKAFPGRYKRLYVSSPTNANECRITGEFEKSDQSHRHVPCPHCGHFHTLEFKNFHWEYTPESLGDNAKRKIVSHAWFECPKCQKRIDENQKNHMLDGGKWIPKYPHIKHHRGFHINAFYIKYGLGKTWPNIAQEWVDSQYDDTKLQVFVNTYLGEVWEDQNDGVESSDLLSRLESFGPIFDGNNPPKVRRVAGVDIQKSPARFEATIVDFEESEEAWVVQHLIIPAETEHESEWEKLYDELSEWGVVFAAIDTGWNGDLAKSFCARNRGWTIPIKGYPGFSRQLVEDEKRRNQRMRSRKKKGMPSEPIGVDQGKQLVYARLKMESPTTYEVDKETGEISTSQREPRPGYIHYKNDACFDDEYFAQLTAEKLVTKKKAGREIREWKQIRKRNEALDCMVYALAAFRLSKSKGFGAKSKPSKTTRPGQKQIKPKHQKPASGGKLF